MKTSDTSGTTSAYAVVTTSSRGFRCGPLTRQVEPRTIAVLVILFLLILAFVLATFVLATFVLATLMVSGAGLNTVEALHVLTLQADDSPESRFATTVITQWRLPRTVAAIAVGAALALSGCLMQVITRNALGTPDILGFNTGAYSGVIAALSLGYTSFSSNVVAAVLGGGRSPL